MTRSIFDPTGGEAERSGNRNLGPDARNLSHMPPDIVDGEADDADAAADPAADAAHANVNEVAVNSDEAAERLAAMQGDDEEANESDNIET